MVYIGIDPGIKGAIAFVQSDPPDYAVQPMPSYSDQDKLRKTFEIVGDLIKHGSHFKVVIEKAGMRPNQSGTITTLVNYGILLGICIAYQIPYEEISSMKWKKYFNLSKDKALSIKKAKELFPLLAETIGKSDGMAEALLIAEYGRRKL